MYLFLDTNLKFYSPAFIYINGSIAEDKTGVISCKLKTFHLYSKVS